MANEPAPQIPGWRVVLRGDLLTAIRRIEITKYQERHGALMEVSAADEGELWLLCDAQTRLAERLATAEACRRVTGVDGPMSGAGTIPLSRERNSGPPAGRF